MLNRKISGKLASWKNRKGHHPLIISGLRQIGKTTSVRLFGEQNYDNVVYLDLRLNRTIHTAFDGDFTVDEMVLAITANDPSVNFENGKTLVILDEIQDCPNARSSLKYWDLDGRYDVIATGSFLGVKGFRAPYGRGIPVGYEEHLTMYPLSFEEFLDNLGISENILNYVNECIANLNPVMNSVHESFRKYYLQYLVVGGMPEAVNTFLESHDLNQVRDIQKRIIASIRDDFGRYFDKNGTEKINEVLKLRAEACLDSLPAQLSKEYKKFQYSLVNAKGHSTEKADGLQYLTDLGLVYKAYNLREMAVPFEGNKVDTEFKVFIADTGLLISMLETGTAAAVLSGDLSAYKGAIAENMVAVAFSSLEIPLYYFRNSSGSPELDFIVNDKGAAVIIECKSSNGRATSMKFVLTHPDRFGKLRGVKIVDANIGKSGLYTTYPLYSLEMLFDKKEALIVDIPDVDSLNALFRK